MGDNDKWKRAPGKKDADRAQRLAAELRANLKKRKTQARQRKTTDVADAPASPDDKATSSN